MNAEVVLAGASHVEPTGQVTVLTSGNLNDENTLKPPLKPETPDLVAPRPGVIDHASPRFAHEFPARSLSILRLHAKK